MAVCKFKNGSMVGDYLEPYLVAEVNSSHNGSIETAFEMILKAKDAKVNCVKFQSWSAETLYCEGYYKQNPIAKRIVGKFSFTEDELFEISKFCKEQKMAFASTPYSFQEVDFLLEKCDVPFIKIASMELNYHSFLKYIAETGTPIVLSTGMGELGEIKKAVEVIKQAGNQELCLLHCVSVYPTEATNIRLNNIVGLREEFPEIPIGFSDHSIGRSLATASVALGAALVEKHFTLDSSVVGMDNQMATEPEELAEMVQGCHEVYMAMGGKERILSNAELAQRDKMRRSVVATRDLVEGEIIKESDLTAKRPGNGISPLNIQQMVGRTIKHNISYDTLICDSDLV